MKKSCASKPPHHFPELMCKSLPLFLSRLHSVNTPLWRTTSFKAAISKTSLCRTAGSGTAGFYITLSRTVSFNIAIFYASLSRTDGFKTAMFYNCTLQNRHLCLHSNTLLGALETQFLIFCLSPEPHATNDLKTRGVGKGGVPPPK